MGGTMKKRVLILVAMVVMASAVGAEGGGPVAPSQGDKCPVCGMFVAKYPEFLCQVVFEDGSRAFFDGAKDMFKYYWNLPRYNPSRRQSDIRAVYVTEYYDQELVDGFKAYYVVGSTVYGPMGKELIPVKDEDAARELLVDHSGSSFLKFEEVTVEVLKTLD
jgi:nitrous oxide reductase accessory protein NosL